MKRILIAILLSGVLVLSVTPIALADDPDNLTQGDNVGSGIAAAGTTGDIIEVDPGAIPCANVADFEDVTGGPGAGTHYDGILVSGGLQFAERFVGQTLSFSGDFDVLSGTPTSPLTLQTGAANQNVGAVEIFIPDNNHVLGWGHLGYPNFAAGGEGALAVLFPCPQSQVKFYVQGPNGGSATVNFFRGDGTIIGTAIISLPYSDQTYGFEQTGGGCEIAGLSIHNDDPGGIAYDNFCYATCTTPPEEPEIPVEVGGEVSSINKAYLLTPWITLAAAMLVISGITLAVRRRRIQN